MIGILPMAWMVAPPPPAYYCCPLQEEEGLVYLLAHLASSQLMSGDDSWLLYLVVRSTYRCIMLYACPSVFRV